jgi:hypothetical protein
MSICSHYFIKFWLFFYPEDGGSKLFRKVCNDLQEYSEVTSLEVIESEKTVANINLISRIKIIAD